MSIVSLAGLPAHPVVCDFLNVTFPLSVEDEVRGLLARALVMAGASAVTDDLWQLVPPPASREEALAFLARPGTVKVERRGQVLKVGISGMSCAAFRAQNLWLPLLADFAAYEHRVTSMDLALDVAVDTPPVLEALYRAGVDGRVSLGRKALPPAQVTRYTGIDARGVETGTVYLGSRAKREITLRAYDKRHEREVRGLGAPGPLTRFEATVKGVGASLRDAAEPASLFWHYVGGVLGPRPDSVPDWAAAGVGYVLEPRKERDYWRAIQAGVEAIGAHLDRLGEMADKLSPVFGRKFLLGLLSARLGLGSAPQPASAAA